MWTKVIDIMARKVLIKHLPMQLIPSPVYPPLQVHVKDPGVFVHMAFESQGDDIHSSISVRAG